MPLANHFFPRRLGTPSLPRRAWGAIFVAALLGFAGCKEPEDMGDVFDDEIVIPDSVLEEELPAWGRRKSRPEGTARDIGHSFSVYTTRYGPLPELAPPEPKPTAGPLGKPWAMFQGDAGFSGREEAGRLDIPLLLKWHFSSSHSIESSPLVADGRVYCATRDGYVFCLAFQNGEKLWATRLDGQVTGTPVADGDSLYVPALDGNVYIVDTENGNVRNKLITRRPSVDFSGYLKGRGAAIAGHLVKDGGFLYYAGRGGRLYQYNLQKKEVTSSTPLFGPIEAGGFVVRGNIAIAASASGQLNAVHIGSTASKPLWQARITRAGSDAFRFPLTLVGSLVLVTTGHDRYLLARDVLTGRGRWSVTLEGPGTAPACADGMTAYISCKVSQTSCNLTAVDLATGKIRWKAPLLGSNVGPPLLANGMIFVGLTGATHSLAALDTSNGELLWQTREFSAIATLPAPYAGHLVTASNRGYVAVYEPCSELTDNPGVTEETPLPGPYVDWVGRVQNFRWRYGRWKPDKESTISYRMTDFAFEIHPENDATPWAVLSKPMVPLEPFMFGPTYTGLLFPSGSKSKVRIIGVRGIDRPHERFYDIRIGDRNRVVTALIIASLIRGRWKPIYVNNWFTSWRLEIPGAGDPAIAGYFADKRRPFDVYMKISNKKTLDLLSVFDRAFIAQAPQMPVAHGKIISAENPDGLAFRLEHYWGKRNADEVMPRLLFGKMDRLMLLELHP